MTTRTITGNIKSLTDSAVATGTVTFEKLATSTTGSTIHQSGVTTATTDGSGDFSIDLAVPASGSYRYRMILPNGASFYFSIAAGASVNVATLIVAETIEDSDAIVEALAAYLPLAGGTLTGQLNFSGTTHAGIKLLSLTTAQRDALTPANGMVIYNTTTATGQVYQGGAWVSVGGGGGASDVTDLTTTTGNVAEMLNVAAGGGLQYRTVAQVLADLQDSGALATPDIGVIVQGYDADLAAIATLTPANDDVLQRKAGAWTNRTVAQYVTDILAGWAAHITTFLQSANAAAARTAIGAGTGNGDVTGPASSVDNTIPRFDSTTGKILQGGTDAPIYTDDGRIQVKSSGTVYGGMRASGGKLFLDGAIPATSYNPIVLNASEVEFQSSGARHGLIVKKTAITTAQTVIADAAGDVTLVLSGTFTVSDGAGNVAGGVITATAPSGTFNLYDDGGTNTCQLQISAGGAVTVIRTAGSRTYAVNLQLNWM